MVNTGPHQCFPLKFCLINLHLWSEPTTNKFSWGRPMSKCPYEALLLPLFSAICQDNPPLFPLSKTCALICLSHTVGIPIEIPLIWEMCLGKTRSRRSWSLTHTHTCTERVGWWVWFSLQRRKGGKGSSSHMRTTFLNMQLCYRRIHEERWGERKSEEAERSK